MPGTEPGAWSIGAPHSARTPCGFRAMSTTRSGGSRPLVPEHADQSFRRWCPAIPADVVHLDRRVPES